MHSCVICPICNEDLGYFLIDCTDCGHIFHGKCLQKWMQRTQTCPECYKRCTRANPVFPKTAHAAGSSTEILKLKKELADFKRASREFQDVLSETIEIFKKKNVRKSQTCEILRQRIENLKIESIRDKHKLQIVQKELEHTRSKEGKLRELYENLTKLHNEVFMENKNLLQNAKNLKEEAEQAKNKLQIDMEPQHKQFKVKKLLEQLNIVNCMHLH